MLRMFFRLSPRRFSVDVGEDTHKVFTIVHERHIDWVLWIREGITSLFII